MAKVEKVKCPRCGEKSVPGRKCGECGLMLDIKTVKVELAPGEDPAVVDQKSSYASPPPEKTLGKKNKKTKECLSCHREMKIIGRGLCGGCYARLKKDGELDIQYPVGKRQKKPIEPPQQVPPVVIEKPLLDFETAGVVLPFSERDRDLFAGLEAMAEKERRSVANQVLFLLGRCL